MCRICYHIKNIECEKRQTKEERLLEQAKALSNSSEAYAQSFMWAMRKETTSMNDITTAIRQAKKK